MTLQSHPPRRKLPDNLAAWNVTIESTLQRGQSIPLKTSPQFRQRSKPTSSSGPCFRNHNAACRSSLPINAFSFPGTKTEHPPKVLQQQTGMPNNRGWYRPLYAYFSTSGD
ncbi:unnamed protein product [Ectocarpus sp. 13 AM-2016]